MAHSRLASPSATIAVLRAHGLYTRKALGQHFLVDDNIIGRIMDLADVGPDAVVLEVGPGIGTLTVALCAAARHVVAVECDDRLGPLLAELSAEEGNLTVVHADAVQVEADRITAPSGPPTQLIANLPYAVAATVVLRFFEILPHLQVATVMVQSEVADRMLAAPGSKAYGAYTVKLGLLARGAGRFQVAPGCFLPPPRVDSAVVRLERTELGIPAEAVRAAARTAEAAFAQRRKTLRNSVRATLGCPSDALDQALFEAGVDGGRRAETLAVEEFVRLGESLLAHGLLP